MFQGELQQKEDLETRLEMPSLGLDIPGIWGYNLLPAADTYIALKLSSDEAKS